MAGDAWVHRRMASVTSEAKFEAIVRDGRHVDERNAAPVATGMSAKIEQGEST